MSDGAPLILSLILDPATQAKFDSLREAHFPTHRNYLRAHLTLFHAIPAAQEIAFRNALSKISRESPRIPLLPLGWRSLGNGVAAYFQSEPIAEIHAALQKEFQPHLTAQDQKKIKPHITVQNKASAADANALLAALSSCESLSAAWGEGLRLSRYLGGPWETLEDFHFCGSTHGAISS